MIVNADHRGRTIDGRATYRPLIQLEEDDYPPDSKYWHGCAIQAAKRLSARMGYEEYCAWIDAQEEPEHWRALYELVRGKEKELDGFAAQLQDSTDDAQQRQAAIAAVAGEGRHRGGGQGRQGAGPGEPGNRKIEGNEDAGRELIMDVYFPLDFQTVISNAPVAIKFKQEYMQIDPREEDQFVTTCYLRPLTGPKKLFVGATVFNPKDRYQLLLQGKKIALARAIWQWLWPSLSITHKQAWDLARHAVREWLKEQADREALEAVAQEMERLEEEKAKALVDQALAE